MTRDLAERLGTLHGDTADELRREALEACREAVDASIGFFFRPTPDIDNIVRYQDIMVVGCPETAALYDQYDGRPMQEGTVADSGARVMSARRGGWSLQNPNRRHSNRFSALSADMDMERMKGVASYQEMYAPLGIVDHARMLAQNGNRILAWFGVLNRADRGPIAPRAVEELNRAARQAVAVIRAADALDRWSGGTGFATFLPSGKLEAATPNIAQWWDTQDHEHIAAHVRQLDRDPAARTRLALRGAAIQLLRMDAAGSVRYLATFEEAPLTLSPFARLSDRRRQVAELAVLGMTGPEIAANMELSPNTVKTQLRHIYDELGVTNRAELVRLAEGSLVLP